MITSADIKRLGKKTALDRFIAVQCNNDPDVLIGYINTALNDLLNTDLAAARKLLQPIQRIFGHLSEDNLGRLRAIEARLEHRCGRSKQAVKKYTEAITHLTRVRNYDSAARAKIGLMDAYMYLGQYTDALDVGKKALIYFRRKDDIRAARVMTNIGNVYHRLDRNNLALRYYERARRWFEKDGGIALAIVDYNRANIYANLNQLDRAEKLYRQAAQLYRQHNLDLAAVKVEYSLAYTYFLQGKYSHSLTVFERVLESFSTLGDDNSANTTRLDLAEINNQLNQYSIAASLGTQALDHFRKTGLRYEEAKTCFFMAEAMIGMGDVREVSHYLRKAGSLFDRERNTLWLGMIELLRCRLQLHRRRFAEALKTATRARAYFHQSGDKRRGRDVDILRLQAAIAAGASPQTIISGKRLLKKNLVASQQYRVLDALGQYHMKKQDPETAYDYYSRAVDVIEHMLSELAVDETQFFFAADKYGTYLNATDCLLRLNRPQDAFMQHSRALSMLNQKKYSSGIMRDKIPGHLLEKHDQLRARLKQLNRPPDTMTRSLATVSQQHDLEQQLWATERRMRAYVIPEIDRPGPGALKLSDYAACLADNDALVTFIGDESKLGAFIVRPSGIRYVHLPSSSPRLRSIVRELQFLMEKSVYSGTSGAQTRAGIDGYLARLKDILIEPLELGDDIERVIFLVDGIFAQLPYSAIYDDYHGRLCQRFTINLITNPLDLKNHSGTTLHLNTKRWAVFAASSPGLPMVESEGNSIAGLHSRSVLFSGERATCRQLRQELGGNNGAVHIAAHASRASENPLFSRILLNDGPFFPFDLFEAGVTADVVSLSGCQTAAPGIYYGNSFSLAKVFYQSGARFVLASLWSVSDKLSSAFMIRFYTALSEGGDVTSAYTAAMNEIRMHNSNPACWSPYILLGL